MSNLEFMIAKVKQYVKKYKTKNGTKKESIFKTKLFDNKLIIITIIGSILLHIAMSNIPLTQDFLDIVPLSLNTIIWTFGLSLIVIVVFEIYKLIRKIIKGE